MPFFHSPATLSGFPPVWGRLWCGRPGCPKGWAQEGRRDARTTNLAESPFSRIGTIMHSLRVGVGVLLGLSCLFGHTGMSCLAAERPNIIFILADDLGYGELGCYGQKQIQTPNLDRMAAEGMRFTDCYAGSTVCAPSRCTLMTGLHTGHARIRGNDPVPLRPEDVTVAEILKPAGYATALIGKWGLGEAGTSGIPNSKASITSSAI